MEEEILNYLPTVMFRRTPCNKSKDFFSLVGTSLLFVALLQAHTKKNLNIKILFLKVLKNDYEILLTID